MDNEVKEINEELQVYLNAIEKYVPTEWTLQYGKWDAFRKKIEELVDEWDDSIDRMDDMEKKIKTQVWRLKLMDGDDDNAVIENVITELEDMTDNW